ncbi:HAMP domain-containing protein [Cyanobium sp. HWJ4-Hawea]|nr:HAMP domain-containing protein [Cyanobium sp. HWJ4-Hawea]
MAFPVLNKASLSFRLVGFFMLSWLGSLLLFRSVLAAKIEQNQIGQSVNILAHNISLSELALERYPPAAVSNLNGYQLLVHQLPRQAGNSDGVLLRQLSILKPLLCDRLGHCPEMEPALKPDRGIWIHLASPLEPVWLFFPLPSAQFLSTDPLLLSLSLITGSVMAGAMFLFLEVRRPLRRLEQAMAEVRSGADGSPAPATGALEVRQLSLHFNSMLSRIQASERERQTMLAGIAHDLNSPLTRLRLRLQGGSAPGDSLLCLDSHAQRKLGADLDALGRITQQFLLFAGSGSREGFVEVPLHQLLEELSAHYDGQDLRLELDEIQASVQPIALIRAIGNLIDNALEYGEAPLLLRLILLNPYAYAIEVIDRGPGIPDQELDLAVEPFQRLDRARRGEGHCGLGLAIAKRIALAHGGDLQLNPIPAAEGGGLCACFWGSCQPLERA